jgi:hypothetical protein
MMENSNATSKIPAEQPNQNIPGNFHKEWTGFLLNVLDNHLDAETKVTILRACASFHYRDARMEEIVVQYRGNLSGFIQFLTEQWQWLVTYDPIQQTIRADENKSDCVYPLVQQGSQEISDTLCHCSAGFAMRMFSSVIEKSVEATVVQSVLRGDKSCVYLIQM